MRDPNRIYNIMNRLAAIWSTVPDQRLGQFLCNILGQYASETKKDPFFPECEEMISKLEEMYGVK